MARAVQAEVMRRPNSAVAIRDLLGVVAVCRPAVGTGFLRFAAAVLRARADSQEAKLQKPQRKREVSARGSVPSVDWPSVLWLHHFAELPRRSDLRSGLCGNQHGELT